MNCGRCGRGLTIGEMVDGVTRCARCPQVVSWKPASKALKKAAKDPLVQAAYPCKHEHLTFKEWGRELHCIDCDKRWLLQLKGQDTPDYGTVNKDLSDLDTRHSPHKAPRFVKE